MTCNWTRELADGALDALALVEASVSDNRVNRDAVLKHADLTLLVSGLVVLASTLRQSLATAYGVKPAAIDHYVRHQLIAAGDEAT